MNFIYFPNSQIEYNTTWMWCDIGFTYDFHNHKYNIYFVKYLKIFEEFTVPGFTIVDRNDVMSYLERSRKSAFNDKLYTVLAINCNNSGMRVKRIPAAPYDFPTNITIYNHYSNLLMSVSFFLRSVEGDDPVVFGQVSYNTIGQDQTHEMYLEMDYPDFMYIAKNPKEFMDKVYSLVELKKQKKYFTPVQYFK